MFSFPAEISTDLLKKFASDETLRAGEYIEVYLYFKSTAEHVRALGVRYQLAQDAIEIDLIKATDFVKERSLLSYCNEAYSILVRPADVTVGTGVGFLVVDYGELKDVNEVSLVNDDITKSLRALIYVKEINFTEINGMHGIYVSYNKSEVPEDKAFSTAVGEIDGISAVKKVVQ